MKILPLILFGISALITTSFITWSVYTDQWSNVMAFMVGAGALFVANIGFQELLDTTKPE